MDIRCTSGGHRKRIGSASEADFDVCTQIADGARELVASGRRFAKPEWNGRRRAFRVGDADDAAPDLLNLPRRIAGLEQVAGGALQLIMLVERAHEGVSMMWVHEIA